MKKRLLMLVLIGIILIGGCVKMELPSLKITEEDITQFRNEYRQSLRLFIKEGYIPLKFNESFSKEYEEEGGYFLTLWDEEKKVSVVSPLNYSKYGFVTEFYFSKEGGQGEITFQYKNSTNLELIKDFFNIDILSNYDADKGYGYGRDSINGYEYVFSTTLNEKWNYMVVGILYSKDPNLKVFDISESVNSLYEKARIGLWY